MVPLFTTMAWFDSKEIASGAAHHYSRGRGGAFDFVAYFIAGILGANGSVLLGGCLTVFIAARMIRTIGDNRRLKETLSTDPGITYTDLQIEEFGQEYLRRRKRHRNRMLLIIPALLSGVVLYLLKLPQQLAIGLSIVLCGALIYQDIKDWRCPACNELFGKEGAVQAGLGRVRFKTLFAASGSQGGRRSCPACGVILS